jgi:LysW-gamma-L-lysine/LysW-L-ornithine aminotransferase
MNKKHIQEVEDQYEFGTYPKRDIVLVAGSGATVTDSEGKLYIDCAAGVGVANIGHANEKVAEAITKQANRLITCYSIFYNDQRAELVKKLVSIAPKSIKKVFLCNSGTEAVEAAMKFARSTTGKQEIIALMRGFHGKTMGSLAATWNKAYQKPFAPILSGVLHVPANNIEKLEAAINKNTAAVLIEVVQGEGGVRPLDKDYIKAVRKITKEKGIILIIDEVQSGMGRTGKMFACEHYNLEPDILCSAKAIAGGIPMGATLCAEHLTAPKKSHTSTFGGNPLACAASLATLQFMEDEDIIAKTETNGNYFIDKLRAINSPKIREVRGLGLMIGVELKERSGFYVSKLMDHGVIALLAGPTVIRFLPPLVITKEQIDAVVEAVDAVLKLEASSK